MVTVDVKSIFSKRTFAVFNLASAASVHRGGGSIGACEVLNLVLKIFTRFLKLTRSDALVTTPERNQFFFFFIF